MTRAQLCWLLWLVPMVTLAGCDGGQIVVFALPPVASAPSSAGAGSSGLPLAAGAGGSGGGTAEAAGGGGLATSGEGGSGGETLCHSSDDCDGSAWFCKKQNCSDANGVCVPLPVSDDPHQAPVCGCDHMTYFNDTLRQQRGISATIVDTECGADVQTCSINDDCGPGGSCSHQTSQTSGCSKQGRGQCWVLPFDCDTTSDRPHWLPCPPPGGPLPTPPPCMTTCQAVQSGFGYFAAPNNACH